MSAQRAFSFFCPGLEELLNADTHSPAGKLANELNGASLLLEHKHFKRVSVVVLET